MQSARFQRASDKRKLQQMDLGIFNAAKTLNQRIGVIAGILQEASQFTAFFNV